MTSAEFVGELKPLLEARPGLSGVKVHLAWTPDVVAPAIVLVRARIAHEINWVASGPERQDTVTVPGIVFTSGATPQAAADAAEDVCLEIGSQVTTAPPQVGVQTLKAELSSLGWMPFPSDKGGWLVDCEFDITYLADIA